MNHLKELQLFLAIGLCAVCIATAEDVSIADGNALMKYLCPSSETLPPNTNLLLSEPQFNVPYEYQEGRFCLIENTSNLTISPSSQLLSAGHAFVAIVCSVEPHWRPTVGFGFLNITNLTIKSTVLIGCASYISAEAVRHVNETGQFLYYSRSEVSLFLSHCNHLKMHNVSVGSLSDGAFCTFYDAMYRTIIGVNLCGSSEIVNLLPLLDSESNSLNYPLSKMFVYYTDNTITSLNLKCNLSLTSNSISSNSGTKFSTLEHTNKKMRIPSDEFEDFVLLLSQSYSVNVTLQIGPHNVPMTSDMYSNQPSHIALVFINNDINRTGSHVTFQGYDLPYELCTQENLGTFNYEAFQPFALTVAFIETTSVSTDTHKIMPQSSLLIKNTAFVRHRPTSSDLSTLQSLLLIRKLPGCSDNEVALENVSWCENDLSQEGSSVDFLPLMTVHVDEEEGSVTGNLYLKLDSLFVQHNAIFGDVSRKQAHCLVCLYNIEEVTMVGTNYFADNTGTSIYVVSSNLRISGNLTIKDGYAYRGGGIYLDSSSTLYLQEPLLAGFYNNIADEGSAIYAPVNPHGVSVIQILPNRGYSIENCTSMNISLTFQNNGGSILRSIYAPQFSFSGSQSSPNLSFTQYTWDYASSRSQYAYTKLIDSILHMEPRDKFTSLSNGLCIQQHGSLAWKCNYIDLTKHQLHNDGRDPCSVYNTSELPLDSASNLTIIYPGQKVASTYYASNQIYDIRLCHRSDSGKFQFLPYCDWDSSTVGGKLEITVRQNSSHKKSEDDFYVALLTNQDVQYTLPIFKWKMVDCPLGFHLNNGSCTCHPQLMEHGYICNINTVGFYSPPNFWTGFEKTGYHGTIKFLFSHYCPPQFCDTETQDFHIESDPSLACLGNRTGVLCGECKQNNSVVFGSYACFSHCTNTYLLTLPVYALAGLLLVLVLFVLRLTVATGTINGIIFYANMLGLVMEKLTEHSKVNGHYEMFIRVFISLLNLDLGFPLCLYEGMTTAVNVGLQFVFPVYLWSIVIVLIIVSRFSTRVSKWIAKSSVQVLATLFYLSFSKLVRTVIEIFSPSTVYLIDSSGNHYFKSVAYSDGQDYGNTTHAILFLLAVTFTLLFLLPYALLVTFSYCLTRFRVVNRFKPFVDAYGGPFKDKWRFWFGLRLWITILLYGLDGGLEGINSNVMFIIHTLIIMAFIVLQGYIQPFKNVVIGLVDAFFMMNYWLLVEIREYSIFNGGYIFLTSSAVLFTCLIVILHLCALKFNVKLTISNLSQKLRFKTRGYERLNNVAENEENSDLDLFKAAEERTFYATY